jgi:Glycosidases
MIWGDFELLKTADDIFAYERHYQGETWLVVNNFSNNENKLDLPDIKPGEVVIQNYLEEIKSLSNLTLKPWQSFVVKVVK